MVAYTASFSGEGGSDDGRGISSIAASNSSRPFITRTARSYWANTLAANWASIFFPRSSECDGERFPGSNSRSSIVSEHSLIINRAVVIQKEHFQAHPVPGFDLGR